MSNSIERCACGSLLLAASERRWSACEPCQLRGQHSTARAVAALGVTAETSGAVVNFCHHGYLRAVCAECRAEADDSVAEDQRRRQGREG
ncbi:MAG: hypothetical protein IVW57_03185 [Ktedonobacterales bacterium]|nr:hypothetical protein [Ktedonobacterales bacterium]